MVPLKALCELDPHKLLKVTYNSISRIYRERIEIWPHQMTHVHENRPYVPHMSSVEGAKGPYLE